MAFTMQEIISQMSAENIKRRQSFNREYQIYEDNPYSFGFKDEADVAVIKAEIRMAKKYMQEQENLLAHIKIAFANIQLTQTSSVL